MNRFEHCHGGGHAFETYKKLESKFTDEFQTLTFELLIELYARFQMDSKLISDRDFSNIKNIWRSIASELKVLEQYPYTLEAFPQSHPMAKDASIECKKRLGLSGPN